MKKKNALSPRKDYFAKLYNARSTGNKWLLHIYVLVCTLPPIYIALIKNETLKNQDGALLVVILLLLIWYLYGFAIQKFPQRNISASMIIGNILVYTIYTFFTLGGKSVMQTLYFDGAILFSGILLGNILILIRKIKIKKFNDTWMTTFRAALGLFLIFLVFTMSTLTDMSELIQKNSLQTGTYDWSTFVYAAIGFFWTIAVHGKYFSDVTHSFYWHTKNEKQTRAVGRYIGRWILEGGMILTLKGNLGAGKTTLVKGIAEELGITDHITSPTFTLMNIYPIPEPQKDIRQLIHVDTYRLETTEDLVDIGIEEYLGEKNTVCIVEWPEKIAPLLTQKNVLHITIEQTSGDKRIISMGTYE